MSNAFYIKCLSTPHRNWIAARAEELGWVRNHWTHSPSEKDLTFFPNGSFTNSCRDTTEHHHDASTATPEQIDEWLRDGLKPEPGWEYDSEYVKAGRGKIEFYLGGQMVARYHPENFPALRRALDIADPPKPGLTDEQREKIPQLIDTLDAVKRELDKILEAK